MTNIKDSVIFCKKCRAYHRKSWDCTVKTATKKAEVVPNLAEPILDETEVSVVSDETTLVEVEANDVELVETVLDAVEDGKVTPIENQTILKEVSKSAKKNKADKDSDKPE